MNAEQIIRLPKKIGAIEITALDIFKPPIHVVKKAKVDSLTLKRNPSPRTPHPWLDASVQHCDWIGRFLKLSGRSQDSILIQTGNSFFRRYGIFTRASLASSWTKRPSLDIPCSRCLALLFTWDAKVANPTSLSQDLREAFGATSS